MGSPCSPPTANIFMDAFDEEAINTSPVSVNFLGRYIDDTMVVLEKRGLWHLHPTPQQYQLSHI